MQVSPPESYAVVIRKYIQNGYIFKTGDNLHNLGIYYPCFSGRPGMTGNF